jgi:hypothetical protein
VQDLRAHVRDETLASAHSEVEAAGGTIEPLHLLEQGEVVERGELVARSR